MTDYPIVPLPGCPPGGDARRIVGRVDEWVRSTALRDLVRAFGGTPPRAPDVRERLRWLAAFSATVWDFRGGGERWHARRVEFDPGIRDLVERTGPALGLAARGRPAHPRYDHVLVAGGGVRTCLARAGYAAGLLDGPATAGAVAGLGSFRPVTELERSHAEALGLVGIGTEFDAMDAGLRAAFPLGEPAGDDGEAPGTPAGWWVRTYRLPGLTGYVLAACSSEPATRRANTGDTLRFWAERIGRPTPDDRVLLVTTDLHVPFQHCDAVRLLGLPYGCGVETVGMDPTALADPRLRHAYPTASVLQELHSAIRSMVALLAAAQTDVSSIASRNASERCSKLRYRP